MTKHIVISLVMLLSLIVTACSSPTASTPAPTASSSSLAAPTGDDLTQTKDEASVTVKIAPLNLNDQSAATLDFKITLDTHSVDLNYDLATMATLSNDAGEKVQPIKWDGPAGGGHHKEGVLSFPQLKNRGQALTLTLRGVADVPERRFTWKVN
jgi:hypothetical protein